MCFNISLAQSADTLKKQFNAELKYSNTNPVYYTSAFSLPLWPVIKSEDTEHFQLLQWGLIPYWEKTSFANSMLRLISDLFIFYSIFIS